MDTGDRWLVAGRGGPRHWAKVLVDEGWAAKLRRVVDFDLFQGFICIVIV
jgi:hypothetical protein